MNKGLNFKTIESQMQYFQAYENSLQLIEVPFEEKYIQTTFGNSHVICCGDIKNPPLVLLHAASCGSPIWYPNLPCWSQKYCVYAIDLIGETSKSILKKKMKGTKECAQWLDETVRGLGLTKIYLCGLSIGGWNALNYTSYYPERVLKLVLLSPVQTFAKMHLSYFLKIMKMGFHPTRENVENYIGWGSQKEARLPDSIIKQFTLSVQNMNSNAIFPTWIKKSQFKDIKMPVLLMFGENEFAFSTAQAKKRANKYINQLELEIIKDASRLLSFSKADYVNGRILYFLSSKDM